MKKAVEKHDMKPKRKLILIWLLCAAILPVALQAQEYIYITNNDSSITITKYYGTGGDVVIPARLMGCRSPASGTLRFIFCQV